ncbi:winged helix-turn-helix domain-containing protein [Spiribacter halobius]|uniref:OmpR/PhoB-type domain-containing protein n=1 Tax=Sediminicurvatus halobius TaxID=2182432 RepID=A0A2U2N5C5_9GAMM|nr:helix-turn-helix domain-containing protein [Spiribacter halobius]PWG64376.1 hypothetical protein DEM34_05715 [Spiribacter halobius]UEX79276.1 winged helix-turn-helix domain-containing protein [Spiribacter halobius]
MRYLDWQLSSDLGGATHLGSGRSVRFTRAERRLLRALLDHPGSVLNRQRLLDAMAGIGSEATDRSVDFLINRLRRKLDDSARAPRYIETRYGEGYAWIAPAAVDASPASGAFLAIGPVRAGFGSSGWEAEAARYFVDGLARAFDQATVRGKAVAIDPDCPEADAFPGTPPHYTVGLHFVIGHDGRLDCTAMLRDFPRRRLLANRRLTVAADAHAAPEAPCAELARSLLDGLWFSMNYTRRYPPAADDEPLALRLHGTARELAADWATSWREAERRLRTWLAASPEDPEAALMLATTLHTKYVLQGPELLAAGDPRPADEAEMQALTEAALPHVQGSDLFVLAGARILHFACPEARDRAVRLAEEVFENGTALGAAYGTLGQLRLAEGQVAEAVALFDRALEMARPRSRYRSVLLMLKCRALVAAGEEAQARTVAGLLYGCDAQARALLPLLYAADDSIDCSAELELVLARLDAPRARGALLAHHYLAARLLPRRIQRQRLMDRPARLLTAHFGPAILPGEVLPDIPAKLRAVG